MTEVSTLQKFISLLEVSALLPRAETSFRKRSKLSRKQMYLLYLIQHSEELGIDRLQHFAQLLNISNSTLTRNLEKLELKKLIQREGNNESSRFRRNLKLLSLGQMYAIEIEGIFSEQLADLNLEKLFKDKAKSFKQTHQS